MSQAGGGWLDRALGSGKMFKADEFAYTVTCVGKRMGPSLDLDIFKSCLSGSLLKSPDCCHI